MWFVIGLVWLALIWVIFWAYRKKREKLVSARAEKMAALFSQLKLNPQLAGEATVGAVIPTPQSVSLPLRDFIKKERLLPPADALLYYVFKTGLPGHEIFFNLALSDLVDIAPTVHGYDREQKTRRLAQARLDLVICTKQLNVVAVVIGKKTASDAVEAANMRLVDECLQTVGIRLLRIDPAAPPRHEQVRGLVYGASGQTAATNVCGNPAPRP